MGNGVRVLVPLVNLVRVLLHYTAVRDLFHAVVLLPMWYKQDAISLNQLRFPAIIIVFFFCATAPPVGQGLLIHEVSRSHSRTRLSR